MNLHIVLSLLVFAGVYYALTTDIINKSAAAIFGAMILVLSGVLTQETAFEHIDWNVIFLLIGMMIIMSITKRTGLFQYVAIKISKFARGEPLAILILLSLMTALFSAILDNVTTVIIIVPIAILIAVELGIDPVPIVITLAIASNIGGTATLIGDPPNIMIGSAADLGFMDFLLNLGPLVAVILVCFSAMVVLFFGKRMHVTNERKARIMNFDETKAIEDPVLMRKALVVLGLVIIAFLVHGFFGIEPSTVALTGAVLLIILSGQKELEHLFAEIEWTTIFFFIGLFMLVGGLVEAGVMAKISTWLVRVTYGHLRLTRFVVLWASGLLSAVVDNIPFVATMIPLLRHMGETIGPEDIRPIWWTLAAGACLGGNGTLIGASANVVSAGISAKSGHPITFWRFTKYGVFFTLMSLAVSSLYVFLRY